jgi:flavin reductase (DIM6/NTAB) family NADH-FMN oxidoreductase RutF
MHSYEPRTGHGLRHDPFNAIVGPRPIGWISTQSAEGQDTLAPYSFFNAFNYVPPVIGFSSIGYKDTVRNVEQTGEFVWNLVTLSLAQAMNQTCAAVPPHVSEFTLAGLAKEPSQKVRPARVAQSPVALECKLSQLVQLQGADGVKVQSWLVLGEVVAIHIARRLIVDGVYDTALAQPVLRGGGAGDYFTIGAAQLFQMVRPQ